MLDDLNHIAQIDAANMLGIAGGQHKQLSYSFEVALPEHGEINNVVLAGMGGSALAGMVCASWLELPVPFTVERTSQLPAYVGPNSLVIVSSYSGNTAEALAAFAAARSKRAPVVVMTSGGKLKEQAEQANCPLLTLPEGYPPRAAVGFGVRILAEVFEHLGLIKGKVAELAAAAKVLEQQAGSLAPRVKTANNQAKQLAEELLGKSVIVYAGPVLGAAAYKWKISLNENAKNLAWCGLFPEFTHNEIEGWAAHPLEKPFSVVYLRSSLDPEGVGKRLDLSARLLSGRMPAPLEIEAAGESHIAQLLSAIQLGDFTSLYLAVLNGVNPEPVAVIDKLKKQL